MLLTPCMRPRIDGGTISWNQGYQAVSPTARRAANRAMRATRKAKVPPGPKWASTQGVSSRPAVTTLRSVQQTTKTRFTPARATAGAMSRATMPAKGRNESRMPMRVFGSPSSLRNRTKTGPNQVRQVKALFAALWA